MKALESLGARVQAHAKNDRERPALSTDGGAARSYGWLAQEIERAAAALRARGAGPGTRVVMDATRSERYVVTLLACWHVGASAVPVPADLPGEAEATLLSQLGDVFDVRGLAIEAKDSPRTAAASLSGNDEAYVMFTSGSTGVPKGVRIPYRGLPHLFEHQASLFRTRADSRTSWMLAGHFDASISDIGVALWRGAELAIWSGPESGVPMLDFIEANALTQVDLPPAKLPALVARGLPPALETIIVGGEPAAPHALREAARRVHVVNVYGPTETTVCASAQVIDPEHHEDAASLGTPLPGVSFHLAQGGELLISGWGVGLGYLDGGHGAFVRAPGGRTPAYRTGDHAEAMPDGSFRFLGRTDRQVQLRGQRLELTEIESALLAASRVTAAAALLIEDPAPRVIAFVEGDVEAARSQVTKLQEWKRPSEVRALAELPRLGNGKVDLAALASLAESTETASDEAPPTLHALDGAWARVLGRTNASDDDDFFELGGDSVTALELSVEAARAGLALEPEAIFESPRLGDLRRASTRGRSVHDLEAAASGAWSKLALECHEPARARRGVLLTGASGMLGLALLRRAHLFPGRIFALVRGKDQAHATRRIKDLLGGALPGGVEVLRGDLGLDRLGLSAQDLERLHGEVSDVIHAAGAVDLVRSCASLSHVHVAGTARVMSVAAWLGARLHHVSTLSIFVESDLAPGTIKDATRLGAAHRVFGGYAQSKAIGDFLAARYPLGGSLVRPGLLTVDALDPGTQPPLDQMSRVVRGVAGLGAWPSGADARAFDTTPVERLVQLLASLVTSAGEGPMRPVHLANATPATGEKLLDAITAEGFRVQRTETWPPTAMPAPDSHADATDRGVALAALTSRSRDGSGPAGPRSGDLFLASDYRFECAAAAALCPESMPQPPDEQFLRMLVRFAVGQNKASEVTP